MTANAPALAADRAYHSEKAINLDIVTAMNHPGLFAPWFRGGSSWDGWRAILRAAYGLPMSDQEREFFRQVAEREPPSRRVKELWIVAGRRAGKDSIASLITAHAAMFFQAGGRLRPGERVLCAALACDREQAKIVLGYTRSYFTDIPPLAAMIRRETRDGFELDNNVDVSISTNSFRNVRRRPILCAVLDECSFYRDETSSNPDEELYRALKPGMATLSDDAMLIGISTPYRKSGLLFKKFREHYGKGSDDVLVIRAPSLLLNPTLDQGIIAAALEEDPQAAEAEWNAVWRSDIESYVSPEAVDAVVVRGRYELPPVSGMAYSAFVDPSGGGADSMTLAIACRDREGRGVLCCVREAKPPFSPEAVVADFARTLRTYRVDRITGDRWGGEFVREPFRSHGIEYQIADRPKSDFYRDFLPLMNSGKVELLDNRRLIAQLCGLERRVARGTGRDSIDHGPGAHDDLANVVSACLVLTSCSASALWQREMLPVVPQPVRCDLLFAVVVASKSGEAGVVYFAAHTLTGSGICLLDANLTPLSPLLLQSIPTRLTELSAACKPLRGRAIFTTTPLAGELERLGYQSDIIDAVVKDELLAVSAAGHVGAGRVRVCADVFAKNFPLGFLQAAVVQDDDPLRLAFLAGVAIALDVNRAAA
jgi:hypothetical protein